MNHHTVLAILTAGLLPWGASSAGEPAVLKARGTIQAAFTPGDDASALVVEAINQARSQVLVQAYSFTHKDIAKALAAAQQRGVRVTLIADQRQAETLETSLVAWLARQNVEVCLDGEHAAAHDKVMVIDPGSPQAKVITGSFNFTHAAQYRNSENLLLLAGNPQLAEIYATNWKTHHKHCIRLKP